MYAAGTDITKLPYTDTMQKNPLYNPNQQQQQTRNSQKNDQQWGQGNWAYNQSPTPPSGGVDMSAYAPGKAQPMQQSYGTPYGDMAAWSTPQQAQQALGAKPVQYGSGSWGSGAGEPANPYANMGPGVYYGGQQVQGNQEQALAQAMQLRDAVLLQTIDNNKKYSLANAFGKDLGQPTFDYNSAMQQAQNMVQNGFYNPFTQYYNQATDPLQQLGNYAPPQAYNPQQPIGGFAPQPVPSQGTPYGSAGSDPPPVVRDGGMSRMAWALNNPGDPRAEQIIQSSPTLANNMVASGWGPSGPQQGVNAVLWTTPPAQKPAAPQAPQYSRKQVTGSEWDQVEQAWKLPAKPAAPPARGLVRDIAGPWQPQESDRPSMLPVAPRISTTTPTSGYWIQRPDGQWEETQPKMYGGMDPVLKAPEGGGRTLPMPPVGTPSERDAMTQRYRDGMAQPIQPSHHGMPYGGPARERPSPQIFAPPPDAARKKKKGPDPYGLADRGYTDLWPQSKQPPYSGWFY